MASLHSCSLIRLSRNNLIHLYPVGAQPSILKDIKDSMFSFNHVINALELIRLLLVLRPLISR